MEIGTFIMFTFSWPRKRGLCGQVGANQKHTVQGSTKVPSSHPGQVVFGFGQVTFVAPLPDGEEYGQAAAFKGFKPLVKNRN